MLGVALTAALMLQATATDSLFDLAQRLPESQLVLEARSRPLAVREAISDAFSRAGRSSDGASVDLDIAARLASAYATVWSDSFLVHQVARFAELSPADRRTKVTGDSLRRKGNDAFARDGPSAAIALWRLALARFHTVFDTAGMAAALGNIGSAFLTNEDLDSAEVYLRRAQHLARAVGDKRVEGNAAGQLAGVHEYRGDVAAAQRSYAEALALHEAIGDSRGVAATYNNLGLLAEAIGDLDEAKHQFESALAINRRDGRPEVAATNLVNLAGLASVAGDFAVADRLYRDALAAWSAKEEWAQSADALHGIGQLRVRRGDYVAARSALLEALAIYERGGHTAHAVHVRQSLAGVLAAQGNMQGALEQLRHARRDLATLRAGPAIEAGLALAHADFAIRMNDFADAERGYHQARSLYREAGDALGAAEADQGLGLLLILKEDHDSAHVLLNAALRVQTDAGNVRGAALTRLLIGQLSREMGSTALARRELTRAIAELDAAGDPVAAAAALGELAAVDADAGLPARAESLYRAGLDRLGGRTAPDVAWQLRSGLALAHRARGRLEDATRELLAARREVERSGRSLSLPERRAAFLADKWDVYAQLALVEHARGRLDAAFEASERLRAREMLELLARGRLAPASDAPKDLVEREQDLRYRIAELTRELAVADGTGDPVRGPDVSFAGDRARAALVDAQAAYADLLLELREGDPRHAGLVTPSFATWRDVAARLAPTEAFIQYLVSDSATVAFTITRDTLAVVRLGVSRRELVRLTEFVRGTLVPDRSPTTQSLWRAPLARLHQYLIAPVQATGLLAGKRRLVIVPHAELHYLPLSALPDSGGRFLMERYELATAPSASVWLALGARDTRANSKGVLALAPRPDQLPASRREIAAIERLAGTDVLDVSGGAASEATFRREAPRRRVLHLATYGVLNKHNPLFSFVELAPGGGHDGRLEVHEVFGLDLAADLVVLSACQTGLASGALADIPAGDDWVGLTRAFLHAGAAQVVATLWPVDDWATAAFMERFYEIYVDSSDPVLALSRAQQAMAAAPATAHPFFWAGFVVVGGDR